MTKKSKVDEKIAALMAAVEAARQALDEQWLKSAEREKAECHTPSTA